MKRNLTTAGKISQSEAWKTAKPFLGRLIKWTVWAVLAFDLLIVILYIIGSYQKASDDTQLTLVRICLVLSLLLIISSLYGIFLNLFYVFSKRKIFYLSGVAGYILIIVLGAALALISAFIIGAVGGNLG